MGFNSVTNKLINYMDGFYLSNKLTPWIGFSSVKKLINYMDGF
jgi:hypothetical protein